MPRRFLNEHHDGDAVDDTYLLADKQLRANRNADLYLLATLRDKTGQMSGLMWNVTEESMADLDSGQYVHVRGKVQLYQGGLQMILTQIHSVSPEGIDPSEYHPGSNKDVKKLVTRLKEILLSIGDEDLRTLMECYLVDDEFFGQYQMAPAGVKTHHAHHGGLLEHVVNLCEVALAIEKFYPDLNHDILLAGLFLHDSGKIREMDFESTFVYTDPGQLLGHLVIGVEILNEKIREFETMTGRRFPEELSWHLKHLILSHHGTYEYGSPKLPMTPEAIALHHLDNLDAKVNEFTRAIDEDPNASSHWTPYNPRMDRKLFKGSPSD